MTAASQFIFSHWGNCLKKNRIILVNNISEPSIFCFYRTDRKHLFFNESIHFLIYKTARQSVAPKEIMGNY